ncbi:MAG: hypothetical protein J5993_02945 [Clostridia bacterium]|nr:hypothetical protein [Clostridia bacterium]
MQLTPIPFEPPYSEQDFTFSEKKVQGATIGKKDDALFIVSQSRYKLECDQKHLVYIAEGNGHFKWKRGEKDFHRGEGFLLEKIGEYELNGRGKYLIIFEK